MLNADDIDESIEATVCEIKETTQAENKKNAHLYIDSKCTKEDFQDQQPQREQPNQSPDGI